tara:strand:- start:2843 stop:3640 length:798 start_codon:yes stop_codon:yes gene_type:complete
MSADQGRYEQAAKLIWDSWQSGEAISELPINLRPKTRLEGYKVQEQLEKFSGKPVFGWKIAATSSVGQEHIGVSGPIAGILLQQRVFRSKERLVFGKNRMAVAEPEFAFKMGASLLPREEEYTQHEVMSLVDNLYPAIEIPNSRFQNFEKVGENQLIADNACAHEFVIGSAMPATWRNLNLSQQTVSISTQYGAVSDGVGANVLGDPRAALTWLVNELSRHEITLKTGMVVTTGTCAKPLSIKAGAVVTADFGVLGNVQAIFSDS